MLRAEWLTEKITTSHLAKLAYVYVRQSSLGQVNRHRESTDLQYHLVERAVQFGWPRERIQVIDEDLGKSGASATERQGFHHLIAEIGLGRVGLVLSFDASRLARNNSDWYQLLELCSVFGCLIADSERVYDPVLYTDRLLLGLSGMMSEAELHQLRRRLHAGAWNKTQRGELHQPLPVGLVRLPTGEVNFHPDEEIQARIRLVFAKFAELKVAKAVMRYCQEEELSLPSRPLRGPAPHEVIWQPARSSMVLAILKNPAYAGVYTYGRQTQDPTHRRAGHPYSGIVRRPIDQWPIVLHNIYPAYISWETFLANQAQLAANQSRYREERPGVPKKGQALLQGILRCGRCGALMRLRYSGPKGEFPVYECTYAYSEYGAARCQEVRGIKLDEIVENLLLKALAPDQIDLALAALSELDQEYANLKRQRELHLERLRYETERARRQYDAVEPENRLVARTLERRWEEALRELEKAEQAHGSWVRQQQLTMTPQDQQEMLALGADLPKVWHAASTTAADRKQILRLIIQEVIVDAKRVRGKVWYQINWQTGATSEHWYTRRVQNYADYADLEALEQEVRELHAQCKIDQEIAVELNARGFRNTLGGPFNGNTIWLLRKRFGLPAVKPEMPTLGNGTGQLYTVKEAAMLLSVFEGTIYKWLRTGRLHGEQVTKGSTWYVYLDQEQIEALQAYLKRVKGDSQEQA